MPSEIQGTPDLMDNHDSFGFNLKIPSIRHLFA